MTVKNIKDLDVLDICRICDGGGDIDEDALNKEMDDIVQEVLEIGRAHV